ncbi:protein NUCLEAR FUSION DEFECTIVE 4-like [Salvia hispanica]|uniref:protein NUCLEAR FUSION DEFECTIVE 4-like n=1 Tax=Salvia hispanica TaxID=49212 RepID=UPI00200911DB|nr:protein NUCLEAR FUSION DEFECTIVE 4-like [Salvia hispanica]
MAIEWLTLVAAIWLQSINGTNSNFPAYSSELKRILSASQLNLNNLASANDAGKLFGWISGVAADHLPLWLVLLIGSLLGLLGYGLQFLFLTSLSYPLVFLLTALAGNGICWINTVCYLITIRNFPLDRQIAVGLSTSYIGLSAKLYTDIVDVIADSNSSSARAKAFLLLNSALPLLVCLAVAPLARGAVVGKSKRLSRGFFAMFVISMVTGVFAVVTSLKAVVTSLIPSYAILAGMVVILLLPLVVPAGEKVTETVRRRCLIAVHHHDGGGEAVVEKDVESDANVEGVGVVDEIGPLVMVRRLEFWLYFFVYLFGATLGLVFVNNLAQIAESRGCSGTSSLVSLSAAFSFFGRLLPSFLDYFFPRSKRLVSRAGAMGVMMGPMCGAFFLLLNGQDVSLYVGTGVIGICTGAITSISVSTTAELFGTKNFGVNHNILVSNIPIGSFLFGDFAALLYNKARNHNSSLCMGQNCYNTTFILWGSLCCFGTFLAFVLHLRTKKLLCSPKHTTQSVA